MLTEQERFEKQTQLAKDRKSKDWIINIGMASLIETGILVNVAVVANSGEMFLLGGAAGLLTAGSIIRTEVLSTRIDKTRRILAEQHLPRNWHLIR